MQSEIERLQLEASSHELKVRELTERASGREELKSAGDKYQQEIEELKSSILKLETRCVSQKEEIESLKARLSKDELKSRDTRRR